MSDPTTPNGDSPIMNDPAELAQTVAMCRHCFMCRHANPTFRVTRLDSHTPRGYALMLSRLQGGQTTLTVETAQRFFESTVDGLCSELCAYHWREDDVVRAGRREAWVGGLAPARVNEIAETLVNDAGVAVRQFVPQAPEANGKQVLLWNGVRTLTSRPQAGQALVDLLSAVEADFGCVQTEYDLGTTLFDLGRPSEEVRSAALSAAAVISETGAEVIVTPCSDSFRALTSLWPSWGIQLRNNPIVQHTSTFLLPHVTEGRLVPSEGRPVWNRVAIHDSCGTARAGDVVDDPRAVLAALGVEAAEWSHNGRVAECCGGGGCLNEYQPELATRMAAARCDEIPPGCDVVITTGALCASVLATADPVPLVLDFAEFVAALVGPKSSTDTVTLPMSKEDR